MKKKFNIKLANKDEKYADFMGQLDSMGTKFLKAQEPMMNQHAVNLAGLGTRLATGNRRAANRTMKNLSSAKLFDGKSLNEQMGLGIHGGSADAGVFRRGFNNVMAGLGSTKHKRRIQEQGILDTSADTRLNKKRRLTALEQDAESKKKETARNKITNPSAMSTLNNHMPSTRGKVTGASVNDYVKNNLELVDADIKVAATGAVLKSLASGFMKSPQAKTIGKEMAKGVALGTGANLGKGVSDKILKEEKVETKPLGH